MDPPGHSGPDRRGADSLSPTQPQGQAGHAAPRLKNNPQRILTCLTLSPSVSCGRSADEETHSSSGNGGSGEARDHQPAPKGLCHSSLGLRSPRLGGRGLLNVTNPRAIALLSVHHHRYEDLLLGKSVGTTWAGNKDTTPPPWVEAAPSHRGWAQVQAVPQGRGEPTFFYLCQLDRE